MKNVFKLLIVFFAATMQASFFNVGNERFAQVKLEAGQNRAEWYQERLKKSEELLRQAIIEKLKISKKEFLEFQEQAKEWIDVTEQEVQKNGQDIRGSWVANYTLGKMYKEDNSWWQRIAHVCTKHTRFNVTDEKIDTIKQHLKGFGYTGKIANLKPEGSEQLQAYQSLITIRPSLFMLAAADQVFRLRHELSHIQNQDLLFENTIKKYVQSLMKKDFDPEIHQRAEDAFDHQKLQAKEITLQDIDQAQELLMDHWHNFHEYRADLDAMLAMKRCKEFQEEISDIPQYDGYPLEYDYDSFYENNARIPYMQDFLEGLRSDAKNSCA